MKKVLSLVFVVALAATVAYSSQTRTSGLGVDSWMLVEDDSLIWLNPAALQYNTDIVWGELGNAQAFGLPADPQVNSNISIINQWGGISHGLNDMAIAGFIGRPYTNHLQDLDKNLGDADETGTVGDPITALEPNNMFDIMLSKDMGNMVLGLSVNMAGNSESYSEKNELTDTEKDFESNSTELNLTAGALMHNVGPLYELCIVAGYGMPSVDNSSTTVVSGDTDYEETLETDGASYLGAGVRGVYALNSQSNLIGYAEYIAENISSKSSAEDDTGVLWEREKTNKGSRINIGAALNSQVSDNTLLVAALDMNSTRTDADREQKDADGELDKNVPSIESSTTTISLNLAVEHSLADYLRARMGAKTNLINRSKITTDLVDTDEEDLGSGEFITSTPSDSAIISLGLGLDITNNLILDALIRQEVAFSGTYLVSGVPETLSSQLTLMYNF